MGKDARGEARRERNYRRAGEPKQCVVCGRWFTRRSDKTCSTECEQKAFDLRSERAGGMIGSKH